ncbi:MAG: UDP-N-acetylglucosamine 2-epimerase [Patescibacteria group bacterium]
MSKKIKILVVTGTRAEYGILKPVIDAVRISKKLELKLLVTGMHTLKKYGLTINEIKKDKIPINYVVKINETDNMLTALSKEIVGIKKYCERNRPDLILVLGDRDEAFAGAIVGGHLGIPIAHIHGGDFTAGIIDGAIRDSITKFSHLHFTACKKSYKRVLNMGEDKKIVFLVGSPSIDGFKKEKYLTKKELARELKINSSKKWLLFLMHPVPFEKNSIKNQIYNPLKAISGIKDSEKLIIYPNADTGTNIFIKEINKYKKRKDFHVFKNFSRIKYISLLKSIEFLIGNSSSGVIEASCLKIPVINIGTRQKNRERGQNVIDTDYSIKEILEAIKKSESLTFRKKISKSKSPYGDGSSAKKIIKILEKTDYNLLFLKPSVYA